MKLSEQGARRIKANLIGFVPGPRFKSFFRRIYNALINFIGPPRRK